MRIILATIAFVILASPSWGETIEATPRDLYEFGWEYVGERESQYMAFQRACMLADNLAIKVQFASDL